MEDDKATMYASASNQRVTADKGPSANIWKSGKTDKNKKAGPPWGAGFRPVRRFRYRITTNFLTFSKTAPLSPLAEKL
jgi:hypothetical protein